jgi:hypothetical protein
MPRITTVDLTDARNRLKGRTSGYDDRAPYREAIAKLSGDRILELEPDASETIRRLKHDVTRAAKEVNRAIGYGESREGTLLVWLDSPKTRRRRKLTAPTQD